MQHSLPFQCEVICSKFFLCILSSYSALLTLRSPLPQPAVNPVLLKTILYSEFLSRLLAGREGEMFSRTAL